MNKKLKIAIDSRVLSTPLCGITRYLINLLSALSEIDDVNEYLLFSDKDFLYDIKLGGNFKKITFTSGSTLLWEQVKLPRVLLKNKIDILHSPKNYGVPIFKKWKVLLTVHDIIPKIFPQYWKDRSFIEKMTHNFSLYWSIKCADKIFVVSENTKKDLLKIFKIDEKKVETVYSGIDQSFTPSLSISVHMVKGKYGITKEYILHASGIGFNKNTNTVLKAYRKLKESGYAGQLVIFGQASNFSDDILTFARQIGDVIFTGYVPDAELPALYTGAALFLYPSLYEGFGFPPLEAASCGTPSVVSRNSSISEAAGDAVLYIDNPLDSEEIATKSLAALKDDSLRENLIDKGLKNVSNFSWKKNAAKALNAYKDLGSK